MRRFVGCMNLLVFLFVCFEQSLITTATPTSKPSIDLSSINTTTNYHDDYPDYAEIAHKIQRLPAGSVGMDLLTPMPLPTYYIQLCKSNIELITPRSIMNKNNKRVRVVNYPEYPQTIRTEICSENNRPCSYSENFPNNLKPICKQKYIYRQMAIITDSDDVVVEDIPIPSSCECALKDIIMY